VTYRSHADVGGQEGWGRIEHEREGELFHTPWERQAFALTLAMGATGAWNIDMARSRRETLPDYGSLSYYQIWIGALQRLLLDRGLIGVDELAAAHMLHPASPVARVLRASDVARTLASGSPTQRSASGPARFALDDRVRARSHEVPHHTRLPGYAHGKVGRIDAIRGAHVFADTNAQGAGEQPQWLYTVAFEARELWRDDAAAAGVTVSIDAWEPYLEPA
jgi:nitrile hydratase